MIARARVDERDAGEIPACDTQPELEQSAIRGGYFESNPIDGDSAVASSLFARDLGPERPTKRIGVGAFTTDIRAAHVAGQRRLVNFGVLLALVFLFDPRLGSGIEQLDGELGLALEHGQKPSFDLSPERFLFPVLLGRIRQRGVMDDAEALKSFGRLGREHGRAVVRQKSPWQAAFLESLRQAVDENLGRLVQIPLQVAAKP